MKCDYDGHEKRFYNNVMLGTTAGCWHTCAYRKGFPDYCHDNKLVQAKPRFNPSMNKTGGALETESFERRDKQLVIFQSSSQA